MTHRQPTRILERSFGVSIRAKRLCYFWIASRGYYMRCRDIEGGFLVELAPPVLSQLKDAGRHLYRMLDTTEQAEGVISASPVLSAIKSVKKYFSIKLDDNGNQI